MLSNIQSTISGVISGLGKLVLLYTGISQVINADLTLGSYMAFTTLAGYFMEPVSNLVSLQLSIQEANISMRRISEILDYEREIGMDEGRNDACGRKLVIQIQWFKKYMWYTSRCIFYTFRNCF